MTQFDLEQQILACWSIIEDIKLLNSKHQDEPGSMTHDDVANYLRTTAMGQEAWVQGRLRMAAHPFRGPFISSYWAGNEVVRKVRERVSDAERPAFIKALYSYANSPESLSMFPQVAN